MYTAAAKLGELGEVGSGSCANGFGSRACWVYGNNTDLEYGANDGDDEEGYCGKGVITGKPHAARIPGVRGMTKKLALSYDVNMLPMLFGLPSGASGLCDGGGCGDILSGPKIHSSTPCAVLGGREFSA